MKYQGPLGVPRFFAVGPFTQEYNQDEDGGDPAEPQADNVDEIDTMLNEIIQEENITLDTIDQQEFATILIELAWLIYPYDTNFGELKRQRLVNCMVSTWAEDWFDGLQDVLNFDKLDTAAGPIEEIAFEANGCIGMVESLTTNFPDLAPTEEEAEEIEVVEVEPPGEEAETVEETEVIDEEDEL